MKCPQCNKFNLVPSVRSNIEIEYCPKCRGVWLDRGELEKIISYSNSEKDSPRVYNRQQKQNFERNDYYKNNNKRDRKKKKESKFSFLEDLLGS